MLYPLRWILFMVLCYSYKFGGFGCYLACWIFITLSFLWCVVVGGLRLEFGWVCFLIDLLYCYFIFLCTALFLFAPLLSGEF